MAKGQKRSNREVRKPKTKKVPQAAAPAAHVVKGRPASLDLPKKKG